VRVDLLEREVPEHQPHLLAQPRHQVLEDVVGLAQAPPSRRAVVPLPQKV
jgi:hypothetical protein